MSRLSLRFFGLFGVLRDAAPLAIPYRKAQALLAYLAAEPGEHRRDALAARFWPDADNATARKELRRLLSVLKKSLADAAGCLELHGQDSVAFNHHGVHSDLDAFLAPSPLCPGVCQSLRRDRCIGDGERLLACYGGHFLQDFPPIAEPFDDWLAARREEFRHRAVLLAERLSQCRERAGDRAMAVRHARRWVETMPWDEAASRRLMGLLAADGLNGAALAEYHRLRAVLEREMGALPDARTRDLADGLLAAAPQVTDDGGLRLITVVAVELEGDETLAQRRNACREAIRCHGGYLVTVHGACLLAYFGYPGARERSGRDALACAFACAALAGVRLGLAADWLESLPNEGLPDARGDTTRAAMHLAAHATPGEVWASPALAAHHGAAGEERRLPGGAPGQYLEALCLSQPAMVVEPPFVGREKEIAAILAHWRKVRRGGSAALLLRGEPGVGKSRLLRELGRRVPRARSTWFVCRAEESHTPFHPLLDLLAINGAGEPADHPLANVPGLELLPGGLASAERREAVLGAAEARLRELLADGPAWLIFEDIHWADASTMEVLARLIRSPAPGLLLIASGRPELPLWPGEEVLPLAPLDDGDAACLAGALAGLAAEAAPVQAIVRRAEGVPLYIEELARLAGAGNGGELPGNLADLLACRLERLGAGLRVAQLAATVGREVELELLRAMGAASAEESLRHMVRLGLMDYPGNGRYAFHHALVRDAAYRSQNEAARRDAHARAAHAVTTLYPQTVDDNPALLAWHYAAAGDAPRAAACHEAAGRQALARSALAEAAYHLRAALDFLGEDATPRRLELLLARGLALASLHGYGAAQTRAVYEQARALAGPMCDDPRLFPLVWGLWLGSGSWWNMHVSVELAQLLVRLAQLSGNPYQIAHASYAIGNSVFWHGRFAESAAFLEQTATCPLDAAALAHGEDPAVSGTAFLAWSYWMLGRHHDALAASRWAIERARRLGHPHTVCFSLIFAAILHRLRREPEEVQALANEALELARHYDLALWEICGRALSAWARAVRGDAAALAEIAVTIEEIQDVIVDAKAILLAQMLDACETLGLWKEALACAEEGLAFVAEKAERHFESEFLRVKGLALFHLGKAKRQAAAALREAVQTAQEFASPSLTLRAATALAACGGEGAELADLRDAQALLAAQY